MASLRITNATLVTQDDERRVLQEDLYVEDGRIAALGRKANVEADRTIDGTGQVVLPGLVNLHTHLAMGLFRGYGDDLHLEPWLQTRIWPAEAKMAKKEMAAGAALGCLESIANGVTSFLDMYFLQEEATYPVVQAAGLRAWLGEGMVDHEAGPNKKLRAIEAFTKRTKDDPLVQGCPAPHATYTCNPETLQEAQRIASDHGVPFHTHCAETRTEVHDVEEKKGARPVAVLDQNGCLAPHSVLAHCGWITKAEATRIGEAGASVAHCPVSNLKLATGGVCPVPELHDSQVNVGLGTDGAASNNSTDLFETMKFAALVQKQHRWDPTVLPAQRVLDMATRDGADALHRPDLGRLEEGGTADLIMVDFRRPGLVPRHDAVSHLVYAAHGGDVSMTVVAGRVLMHQRRFETMDAAAVMAQAQRTAEALVAN